MSLFDLVRHSSEVNTYITMADASLSALGYTEHSFAHVGQVAKTAAYLLETLDYSAHDIDLVQTAAYLHDIGNLVNRVDHSQSGAVMAFRILDHLDVKPEDIAIIITAIGNHDEGTGVAVNPVAAALIVADKTDVRSSRVRKKPLGEYDIHDRVNGAVREAQVKINQDHTIVKLKLSIDTHMCSVMDYFEIFLDRMQMCREAAAKLGLKFKLIINEQQLM